MYSVYFEDKTVNFVNKAEAAAADGHVWEPAANEGISIAKVLEKLENNKALYIKAADPESVFRSFCGQFAMVVAAGGMVVNMAGDTLMIFRNGRWDLPKGHAEPGEELVECAVREVMEECGLEEPEAGEPITETLHFYEAGGIWVIKRTVWFNMRSNQKMLNPQTEEGILWADWVPQEELGVCLEGSYPTIREVFRAAGKLA